MIQQVQRMPATLLERCRQAAVEKNRDFCDWARRALAQLASTPPTELAERRVSYVLDEQVRKRKIVSYTIPNQLFEQINDLLVETRKKTGIEITMTDFTIAAFRLALQRGR